VRVVWAAKHTLPPSTTANARAADNRGRQHTYNAESNSMLRGHKYMKRRRQSQRFKASNDMRPLLLSILKMKKN
jgi:hypothetical protein